MNGKAKRRFQIMSVSWALALASPSAALAEPSLWASVADFLGLSATPGATKGADDELTKGTIWLADLQNDARKQLTAEANYRSPVFTSPDASAVLALQGEQLVQISIASSEAKPLWTIPGIFKLVGFDQSDPSRLLVLSKQDAAISVGILSLASGTISKIAFATNDENQETLGHLMEWERIYGDKRIFVAKQSEEDLAGTIEWTDVMLVSGGAPAKNISRCDGVNCGQPSLSPDGNRAVYVKAP